MWDCHCHLADKQWADMLPERLATAREHGVRGWLSCGYDPDSWTRQVALAEQDAGILIAQGLHPWALPDSDEELTAALRALDERLAAGEGVAVGECGLDFYRARDESGRDRQLRALREQLRLAQHYRLPVVFHCVRAHAALLAEVELHPGLRFMIHGFLGSTQEAEEWLERGAYLSLGPHALSRHDLMRRLPVDRILVETDAPSRGTSLLDLLPVVERWRGEQALAQDQFESNLWRFLGLPQRN
jgi:TatD DNase family protein